MNRDATLEKARESARAEGIAETRAERDQERAAYTQRMKAALERGEQFNAPPPSPCLRAQD